MPGPQTRRRLLRLAGSGAFAALAGCSAIESPFGEAASGPGNQTANRTDQDEHGDDAHGDHEGSLDGPVPRAEVAMATTDGGTHFDPHIVWVESGGTVTWRLESGSHSATAYHPDVGAPRRVPEGSASWDSSVLTEAGVTFERTFETPGVYDYFCRPHESAGMVGSVVVGRPGDGGPGLAAPQSDLPSAAAEKVRSLNRRAVAALDAASGHETGTRGGTAEGDHPTDSTGGDHGH